MNVTGARERSDLVSAHRRRFGRWWGPVVQGERFVKDGDAQDGELWRVPLAGTGRGRRYLFHGAKAAFRRALDSPAVR